MEWLIIVGAVVSFVGLIGLVTSAVKVMKAKRAGLDDAALRARIQKAMVLNMGALALSVLGLMCVILGISLS
ncbi:hypothetical protein XMM379_000623 [Aliiroseovarius sp. xm-m-379]|uniref:Uncharacterized protein n=1 Tax=Aliiroseovarius crassostreae TaxID=154981 RepID=A0A0P7IDG3_9RHOB|nr:MULTISPECIES: hypothetical protein [Aliiroseovarius]KPN62080.1 hypothetical protein AKJ29_07275 [Aliiroseovarius crassostreae]NRP11454.1 hypothetical protein [Aliiroseovarius sp. xm-d-517]NRP23947.1 hypothetical protein [Aliiroseovarius sp. xm-m-379]NRP28806.1 hypothetical protein [Aliiroseovarius sp. xm-m-314]NRP32746.1 hypothetical protein [Aliiroseovarius sp. xm-a-104]